MPALGLNIAKAHLRVSGEAEDELITLYLGAAEGAAASYLNRKLYSDLESLAAAVVDGTAGDDPMVINLEVTAAILLTLGHLYMNREDSVVGVSVVTLPGGAKSLLQPYRVGMGV